MHSCSCCLAARVTLAGRGDGLTDALLCHNYLWTDALLCHTYLWTDALLCHNYLWTDALLCHNYLYTYMKLEWMSEDFVHEA